MRVIEGNIISVEAEFLDAEGQAIYPSNDTMGPIVSVIDTVDNYVLLETVATTGEREGTWVADLAIPDMGLLEDKHLKILWVYVGENGINRNSEELIVEPTVDHRITDVVAIRAEDTEFDVTLPFHFDSVGDTVTFQLSLNNQVIVDGIGAGSAGVSVLSNRSKTCTFRIPLWAASRQLEPMALIVKYRAKGRHSDRLYVYKVWAVTPQILIAASLVEDYIDKARAQNVIPQLEYTQSDIISYLYRGLALFNQLGPRVTGFTGINMQGTILDGWITCACYYALGAQLQAEGQLAFDFTGQVVNLNMDRTPAIEAALGRVENMMQGPVTNMKRLLSKAGVNGGDGSEGGKPIDGSRALGQLGITNAPTTKWATVGNRSIWVNARYRVVG